MRSSYFFLSMVAHCVQLKIHPVKINIFSIDLKKHGNVHSFRKPYFSYSLTARALSLPRCSPYLHTRRVREAETISLSRARVIRFNKKVIRFKMS